ncbi:DUF2141 domain-containing protein [Woodsholea maritima]|uniref:DUF2141 domain-containing protein n=1 Tax=Woodsholea maritima TaxID=240237 RepID=UPI00035F1F51|nr:DUF2141 domain-containing protein [Woodsholea maritima]
MLKLTLTGLIALTIAHGILAPESEAVSEGSNLTLTIEGVETLEGKVMIALFNSEAGYDGGDLYEAVQVRAYDHQVQYQFSHLDPGQYALKIFHDVDGDGELDTNLMGIPSEPVVFSNNAPMRFGPASWNDAQFEIVAGENTHSVRF